MEAEVHRHLLDVLDRWENQPVAVRVVAGEELIAVFAGVLKRRSQEKRPALFWPVESGNGDSAPLERPGIYLHPHLPTVVRVHVGDFVLEYEQAAVTVNVRRLDQELLTSTPREDVA